MKMDHKFSWRSDTAAIDEEALLKQQLDVVAAANGIGTQSSPPPLVEPVPFDPDAERAAFAELLAHLGATDDGDLDTVITSISANAFAEDDFVPNDQEASP
jgi:hypothetical protein